jgi:hypothetical protein
MQRTKEASGTQQHFDENSPLEVKTISTTILWQNPEETKSTRATVALYNGRPRVTIGKFYRIADAEEAQQQHRRYSNSKWLPEPKGKHISLTKDELVGLSQNIRELLISLESVTGNASFKSPEVPRRGTGGFGVADKRTFVHANAPARGVFGNGNYKNAATTPTIKYDGKKRGRKPKNFAEAIAQEGSGASNKNGGGGGGDANNNNNDGFFAPDNQQTKRKCLDAVFDSAIGRECSNVAASSH